LFSDPRRPFEADQAFEPFERDFNAPSETIKCEDIGGREDLGRERGHENDPFRSEERAFRDLMSAFYSLPPSLSPSSFGRLRQLLDGDEDAEREEAPPCARSRSTDRLIHAYAAP
jgi:hypothetical protein